MRIDVILGAGLPPHQVRELAAICEANGIHRLWVQSFPSRRDPWPGLVLAAEATTRLGLGTLPTSPYEVHPLRIADGLFTFNELAGGRASLLVGGLGHSVMRVTGLTAARRVTAVRECIEILKGIAPDRPLDYEGELYTLQHYQPEWAIDTPPSIYAGSTGPRMLRMAGRVADGVMMSDVPLSRMTEVTDHIQAGLGAAGRCRDDFRVSNFYAWHVRGDRDASLAEARRELVWRGLLLPWHTETFLEPDEVQFVDAHRDAFLAAFLDGTGEIRGVPAPLVQALIDHLTFAGGPDALPGIVDKLAAYRDAGLDEVALKVHGEPAAAIRTIGRHLVPALA